jgi:hypothetical protein
MRVGSHAVDRPGQRFEDLLARNIESRAARRFAEEGIEILVLVTQPHDQRYEQLHQCRIELQLLLPQDFRNRLVAAESPPVFFVRQAS